MKRLHPISAVGRVLSLAVRFGSFGLFAGFVLTGPLAMLPFEAVFVLAPLGALVGAAYAVARYYRFTYELADGTLAVDSGVFDRQEREIPLGRIQNVDIERGPVQRLFGLAVVKFETAGGSATEAVLNAVTVDEARTLQSAVAEFRRETTTDSADSGAETGEGDDATGAETTVDATPTQTASGPERQRLYELSTRDLLTLALVSFRPAAPMVLIFSVPFGQEYAVRLLSATVAALGGPPRVSLGRLPAFSSGELLLTAAVAVALFALAAWLLSAAFTITEYHGFRLDYVGDDLRYERGLIQQYSGSIPLEKVQTVTVRENALMRPFGYAALAVETAGYAPGSGSQDASNTAIPLDDRETVVAVAEALTDAEVPTMEQLPRRSRRRYAVRYSLLPVALTGLLAAVDALVTSVPYWYVPLALVPLTAVFGHLTWRHRGFALLDDLFATRSGVLVRATRLVPYYRVQTVIDTRTVFQRRLSLASVTADTASTASLLGGDATAYDIDEERARELHDTLRQRLMAALRSEAGRRHSLDSYVGATIPAESVSDEATPGAPPAEPEPETPVETEEDASGGDPSAGDPSKNDR